MATRRQAAIYARGGHDGSSVADQIAQLRSVAQHMGLEVIDEFIDDADSGLNSRYHRPGLNSLLRTVSSRQIDVVLVWSVDRLGRSVQHLASVLGDIRAAEIDLYLHEQGLDTSTPGGEAMFRMMDVFAEFERGCTHHGSPLAGLRQAAS